MYSEAKKASCLSTLKDEANIKYDAKQVYVNTNYRVKIYARKVLMQKTFAAAATNSLILTYKK